MAEKTGEDRDTMPQKCAVVGCCNRSDDKDRWVVMPHVTELLFHSCLEPEHLHIWTELIAGGHRRLPAHARVCSNHFPLGRPCLRSPFPIVYLSGYEDISEQVRILRDTMNTDHDYPKLRYEEEGEKPRDLLLVSCKEELEENVGKQLTGDSVSAQVCGVKDSGHSCNEQSESSKNLADELSPSSAKHQPASANREEQCGAKLSQGRHEPVLSTDLISPHSTENSTAVKEGQPFRNRKRRYSRDTDHIYNTRISESAKYSQVKKIADRRTDHQYNSRKVVRTVENSCPQIRRNRYTDHMYNMPRTQLNELNNAAAASAHSSNFRSEEKPSPETSAVVDKRVVDKDHMYQHSVRKNRNRVDNKNIDLKNTQMQQCAASKKSLKHEGKNTDHKNEDDQAKLTLTKSENDLLLSCVSVTSASETVSRTSHLTRHSRKPWKGSAKRKKTSAVSKDGGLAQDAGSDKADMASSTVTASPDHSDNELDHVCEDDSLRTGVWHTDHMYVHLNTNILERKGEEPDLTPCFSIEGYKQEHSYANSVEIRYDACLNCSQLVEQLIGTIRQQGDHISDLKKKLYAANARNKQLTSLFSQKPENLE